MQPATVLIGIIAVLMGLWTGPFFHIHEIDGSRLHDRLAMQHSHFPELFLLQDSSGTSMESGLPHRRGIAVTVIAGSGRKAHAMVAEFQSSNVIPEPSIASGTRNRTADARSRSSGAAKFKPAFTPGVDGRETLCFEAGMEMRPNMVFKYWNKYV